MQSYEDKRCYQRYEHSSPMCLFRMDSQDQYYYAEMKDYSSGGLSFLTSQKLVVGHLVYLEMKDYDENATGPEKYKSYNGSVKWANPSSPSDEKAKSSYRYGIEFSKTVNYQC